MNVLRNGAGSLLGLLVLSLQVQGAPEATLPRDVPQKHWAASAVRTVLQTGVMGAPNGVFNGDRKVTRSEAIAALARFARLLEQRRWPRTEPQPVRDVKTTGQWRERTVTRYELAAVLARTGAYAMAGLPKKAAAKPTLSEAIPPKARVGKTRLSPAVLKDLQYLVDRRMLWPGSPLLEGGSEPVKGQELAIAVTQVIAGVNDILTAEPEDREEIPHPPRR